MRTLTASVQPSRQLPTYHLVQRSHWDHCLDSWKSPGKPNEKTVSFVLCVRPPPVTPTKGEKTHRDDSGVVGQKVTGRDMTRLIFSASNVKRQLDRTLWTKVITGTVLQEDQTQTVFMNILALRVWNNLTGISAPAVGHYLWCCI